MRGCPVTRKFTVEEWTEMGRRLERLDPMRFDRVAALAREIVQAYTGDVSPIGVMLAPPAPPPAPPAKRKRTRKKATPPTTVAAMGEPTGEVPQLRATDENRTEPPPARVPAPARLAPPATDRAWTEIGSPGDRVVLVWPTYYSAAVGASALREYGPGCRIFAGWGFTVAVRS